MQFIETKRAEYTAATRGDGRQSVHGTPLDVRLFGNTVDADGCWVFQGAVNKRTGHGRIDRGDGTIRGAHRMAWELASGQPIADGLCVLHRCDNPPCVNPAHLWVGTYAENNHDRDEKGRTRNQYTGKLANFPDLADALHLGGNGLVPQCAAEALQQLADRAGVTL